MVKELPVNVTVATGSPRYRSIIFDCTSSVVVEGKSGMSSTKCGVTQQKASIAAHTMLTFKNQMIVAVRLMPALRIENI
jgi:hypothetical protein